MVLSEGTTEKIPSDTTGIDPRTVRLVAKRLNHYSTPGVERVDYRPSRVSDVVGEMMEGKQ